MLSLVYEEFCLHEETRPAPDVESFCDRYPDWKSSLVSQLQYHRLFSLAAGSTAIAAAASRKPGDDFEEFHLRRFGRGRNVARFPGQGPSLGGKQVVLKVTLDRGQEPKVQGPLDHPHIVPVNSVTYQTGGQLCGLSMPFRPGLPLDEIIKRVNPADAAAQGNGASGKLGRTYQPSLSMYPRASDRARPCRSRATRSDRAATVGRVFPFAAPTLKAWPGS